MSAWDDVKVGGGVSLLPAGLRTFEVTAARAEVNERTQRRQVVLGLTSVAGGGEDTIDLEPWDQSADGVEMWERIFKGAASGLGFEPAGNPTMQDAANQFALYAPSLLGKHVEVEVKHVESKKLKDDGTPFINHRCTYRRLLEAGAPTVAVSHQLDEAFAAAVTSDTDPWA